MENKQDNIKTLINEQEITADAEKGKQKKQHKDHKKVMTTKSLNDFEKDIAIDTSYKFDLIEKNVNAWEITTRNSNYNLDLDNYITRANGDAVKTLMTFEDKKENFKMLIDEDAFTSNLVAKASTNKIGIETARLYHTMRFMLYLNQFEEDAEGNATIKLSVNDYTTLTNTILPNPQRKSEFMKNLERDLMFLGLITVVFRTESNDLIQGGKAQIGKDQVYYTVTKGKNAEFTFTFSNTYMQIHKAVIRQGNYQFQNKNILSLAEPYYLTALKLSSHKGMNKSKNNLNKNKISVKKILDFNIYLKNEKTFKQLKDQSHFYNDIIEPFIASMDASKCIVKKWHFNKHDKGKGSFKNVDEFFKETIIIDEWTDDIIELDADATANKK